MGPPIGNTNRLLHGARTDRPVVLGEWGERHTTAYQYGKKLRRVLERQAGYGQTGGDPMVGLLIDGAVRWEMVAQITRKLIADNPDLQPDQVVSYLNTVAHATRQRNAAARDLLAKHNGATAGGIDVEGLYAAEPETTPIMETEGGLGVADSEETLLPD